MKTILRMLKDQSGATAVEFAFVSLLMVVVVTGVIEFGRSLDMRSKLSHAADVGAREVLLDSTITDGDLETEMRSAFTGTSPQLLDISISLQLIDGNVFRVVSLSYPFNPMIPNIVTEVINISVDRRVPSLTY